MVETSYYWEGTVTGDATLAPYSPDRYHTNWQTLFTEQDDEGLIDDYLNELVVTGISGGVIVDSGAALVDGSFYENTAQVTVAIPLPITDPRIDRIVLQKDWGSQTIRITRLAGTENPAPTPPTLTQTAGAIWEMPLAQVLITIAGVITITDEREFAETPLAPGGALRHIETIVSDGTLTQFDFSDIPQIYRHLMLECVTRHTAGGDPDDAIVLRFNGDAGGNYNNQNIAGTDTGPSASALASSTFAFVEGIPKGSADADYASQGTLHIADYAENTFKTGTSKAVFMPLNAIDVWDTILRGFIWRDTDPITRITLFNFQDPGGAFVAGSTVSLYGVT